MYESVPWYHVVCDYCGDYLDDPYSDCETMFFSFDEIKDALNNQHWIIVDESVGFDEQLVMCYACRRKRNML